MQSLASIPHLKQSLDPTHCNLTKPTTLLPKIRPNPTQPSSTHGPTQPVSISGADFRDGCFRGVPGGAKDRHAARQPRTPVC